MITENIKTETDHLPKPPTVDVGSLARGSAPITLRINTPNFALSWEVSVQEWREIQDFIFSRMTAKIAAEADRKAQELQQALFGEPNAADHARPLGAVACGRLFEEPAGKTTDNSKVQNNAQTRLT